MICLVYVDDCLFFSSYDTNFGDILSKLRKAGLTLQRESDVARFLGFQLNADKEHGKVELTQTGIIDRIITAVGLEDTSLKKHLLNILRTRPAKVVIQSLTTLGLSE